jgi:arylsulfatase A-like enzyme
LPAQDGRSVVPVFAQDRPWDVPVVTEGLQHLDRSHAGGFPQGLTEMGLRTGRYAYFRYSTGEGELYDLFTDPLELRSRYDDPAYASVRRDLTRLWKQYRLCSGDACRAPLPARYVVSDADLAAQVAKDRRARARYYG